MQIRSLKMSLEQTNECPICYNEIGNKNNCMTDCGHSFCFKCIVLCLSTNIESPCPICRAPIGKSKPIDKDADDDGDDDGDYDDNDDDDAEDEFNLNHEERVHHSTLYPLRHSYFHINNLLGLDRDAESSSYDGESFRFKDEYCSKKFAVRRSVFSALSGLKDNEWKMAEFEILKTISKYYGKSSDMIWEEGESIGLANTSLFTTP